MTLPEIPIRPLTQTEIELRQLRHNQDRLDALIDEGKRWLEIQEGVRCWCGGFMPCQFHREDVND